ncbi:MAG: diacylglycerol kinase family protein, partial [Chitinivibrionales bacterium]
MLNRSNGTNFVTTATMQKTKQHQSITAFVLAAHSADSGDRSRSNAALTLLHGRALLEYVINALHNSHLVNHITVIGPDTLDELLCRRYIDQRVDANRATIHEFFSGIHTVSTDIDQPAIVVCSDSVFLSGQDIDAFITRAQHTDADVVVPGATTSSNHCGFKRVEANGKSFCGGLPIFIRDRRQLTTAILRAQQLRLDYVQILGSGALMTGLISLHNRLLNTTPTETVLPVKKTSYSTIPYSAEARTYTRKHIRPPKTKRYRSIKMIVNPGAGQGIQMPRLMKKIIAVQQRTTDRYANIEAYVDTIGRYLADFGIFPDIVFSQSSQHATRLARQYADQKVSLVIAVGGDGTINSIANGLAGSKTAMAVIPVGTINLFAVQMGIPLSLRSSCQLIADGCAHEIDLGKARGRFFTTVMGIGFDAQVIHEADSRLKKILGAMSFLVSGIISAFTYPFHSIRIS